jgi:hypothetical protein
MFDVDIGIAISVTASPFVHGESHGHDNRLLQLGPSHAYACVDALSPSQNCGEG